MDCNLTNRSGTTKYIDKTGNIPMDLGFKKYLKIQYFSIHFSNVFGDPIKS